MLNPSGEQNPKLISILPEVSMWHAPTLILHGEEDLVVSVQQANLLRESLEAGKKPYRFIRYVIVGIGCRRKMSAARQQRFSQKTPDRRATIGV
jgi:hypothetical protein